MALQKGQRSQIIKTGKKMHLDHWSPVPSRPVPPNMFRSARSLTSLHVPEALAEKQLSKHTLQVVVVWSVVEVQGSHVIEVGAKLS